MTEKQMFWTTPSLFLGGQGILMLVFPLVFLGGTSEALETNMFRCRDTQENRED